MHRFMACALALCLAVAFVPGLWAGDDNVPNPLKTLKSVDKNLKKATKKSGFKINCHVMGGVSKSKDHSLYNTSVNVTYNAEVYRALMKVESPEAYRLPGQKGAAKNPERNIWQDVLARKDAVQMTRLMGYPHEVLQNAIKDADKVEWIWTGDEAPEVDEEEEDIEVDEGEAGTTGVAKRKEKDDNPLRGMPHLARVTLEQKTALKFFTQAKDSGCVSGG